MQCNIRRIGSILLTLKKLHLSPTAKVFTMAGMSWDERYAGEEFAYGTEPNTFLKESLESLKLPDRAKCLMLADGEGRNGVFMAQAGHKVTSLDNSKVGLEKAEKLAKEKSVELDTLVGDLADCDLGTGQWDCIVGIFCHLPPPIRERVLTAIPTALRSGGCVLFECYTPDQIAYKTGGPQVPEMMYSSEIFNKAFDGKLMIEKNEELVRDVVEGKYHTGKGAVVQFIARKM